MSIVQNRTTKEQTQIIVSSKEVAAGLVAISILLLQFEVHRRRHLKRGQRWLSFGEEDTGRHLACVHRLVEHDRPVVLRAGLERGGELRERQHAE